MANPAKHVAVVGAGWAGCAAAMELVKAGHKVTMFEAGRTMGGRARLVEIDGKQLDNGQHIMLGAYADTLALMKELGIDIKEACLNLPLQMRYPNGSGMEFVASRLPAPWHTFTALFGAKGLSRSDKMALARFSTTARWMDWRLNKDCTVSELLERYEQTPRLTQLMWRPLCLAALNTPPERASAQVFLNVLRDSLGAQRKASDMLLPKLDLSALFPAMAGRFVEDHQGRVRMRTKVSAIKPLDDGRWQIDATGQSVGGAWMEQVDGIVIAAPANTAAMLLLDIEGEGIETAVTQLSSLRYEPITTVYLQYPEQIRLDQPFYALVDNPAKNDWAQFVFDRGQLSPDQAGLLAVVISASHEAAALPQSELAETIAIQLARVLERMDLAQPSWHQVITEKRATFSCTPGLERPANATGLPGLVLAGDYTQGDYPGTLEGAVRSGKRAAAEILRSMAP